MRKSDKYINLFNKEYLMGSNSVRLLEEMLEKYPLQKDSRVLDLGCGKGLTSMYMVKEAGVNVFANDLWVSATDNNERFKDWGVAENIVPIHADANELPFADEYFDAVVSIDSFHYFSAQPKFFEEKILPLVKPGGVVIIAMPGLKDEIHGNEPDIILEWINSEECEYNLYHSRQWWLKQFGESEQFEIILDFDLNSFESSWKDWLDTKHELTLNDAKFFAKGIGRYLASVGFIIKKNKFNL